jgi:NAD(P)-dependent dehydrogenase (short-subunit alcohol dehydrogenase family)
MTGARPATRMPRALVTGGAGFIGSHLCEGLLFEGYEVVCMDNLSTGSFENVASFLAREADFEYIDHDVSNHIDVPGELDEVYHFASAASPADFGRIPIEILRTGAGYPQLPRAGPRQRSLLYARLHFGGLRRPARASAVRGIQGQRKHNWRKERPRRGQALRRGPHHCIILSPSPPGD